MTDQPSRVMPGRADIEGLQLLESCSYHWIFDGTAHRFRRTPRDAGVRLEPSATWTAYHHLEIDDARSCFAVGLDAAGTRVLRGWLHTDPCRRCGRDGSATGDLQLRILAWKDRLRVRDPQLALSGCGRRHPLRPFGGWGPPPVGAVAVREEGSGRGEE